MGETKIWESKQQKLLGVPVDRNLKFDEYVLSQCRIAGKDLITLIRINKFMTFAQRRNIMNFSLAISHLFGCFAEGRPRHAQIIKMRGPREQSIMMK